MAHDFGFIYRTTNLLTGETYIGQHKTSHKDKSYLGSGKLLKKAISHYGKAYFKREILEKCNSQTCLNRHEKEYIKNEKAIGKGTYNTASGGAGNNSEKLKQAWTNNNELKEKQAQTTAENWKNPAQREKYVQAQKAYWQSDSRRAERSRLMENKWADPTYAEKQRAKLALPETKAKISSKNKETKNAQKEEIARKTQLQWHERIHIPQKDYRRTCFYCTEENKAIPLTKLEKEQITSSTKSQAEIAQTFNITKNEIILIRRAHKNG